MDNEASQQLKNRIISNQCEYQLVPPHNHRTNPAKRAIQTFKVHFISVLCTTDPTFPFYLWDKLIEQTEITLNLLRRSNLHPHLSAYTHLFGIYDYNAKPMAPADTKLLIFDPLNQQRTCVAHGKDGCYILPAMEHYRCYKAIRQETKQEVVTDTVQKFPAYCSMPTMTSAAATINAAIQNQQRHIKLGMKQLCNFDNCQTFLQIPFTTKTQKHSPRCRMINFRGCQRHHQNFHLNAPAKHQKCRPSNLYCLLIVIQHETNNHRIPHPTKQNNTPSMLCLTQTRENY